MRCSGCFYGCRCKWWLIIPKLFISITGSSLIVLAIYICEQITDVANGSLQWTYIAGALNVAAVVIKVLGQSQCVQEKSCCRQVLTVLKLAVHFVTTAIASLNLGRTHLISLQTISVPAIILMVPGTLMIACNAFGWFGMLHRIRWMVILSGVLMLLLVVAEVGVVIAAYQRPVQQTFGPPLLSSMDEYNSTYGFKESWDFLQKKLECCGVVGPQDWLKSRFSVPLSCMNNLSSPYAQGCLTRITNWLDQYKIYIVGMCAVIFATQVLVGILSAMYGSQKIKNGCMV